MEEEKLTLEEVEFIAEYSPVIIVPKFSMTMLQMISENVGPFQPGIPCSVPLWLAIYFKQQRQCTIQPPDWMDVQYLEDKKLEEAESIYFCKLPSPHMMEITQSLLTNAAEDIPLADKMKTLVKDIMDTRSSKLRSSIDKFIASEGTHAGLNNLTMYEISLVRSFLSKSLGHLQILKSNYKLTMDSQSQSMSYSHSNSFTKKL